MSTEEIIKSFVHDISEILDIQDPEIQYKDSDKLDIQAKKKGKQLIISGLDQVQEDVFILIAKAIRREWLKQYLKDMDMQVEDLFPNLNDFYDPVETLGEDEWEQMQWAEERDDVDLKNMRSNLTEIDCETFAFIICSKMVGIPENSIFGICQSDSDEILQHVDAMLLELGIDFANSDDFSLEWKQVYTDIDK